MVCGRLSQAVFLNESTGTALFITAYFLGMFWVCSGASMEFGVWMLALFYLNSCSWLCQNQVLQCPGNSVRSEMLVKTSDIIVRLRGQFSLFPYSLGPAHAEQASLNHFILYPATVNWIRFFCLWSWTFHSPVLQSVCSFINQSKKPLA